MLPLMLFLLLDSMISPCLSDLKPIWRSVSQVMSVPLWPLLDPASFLFLQASHTGMRSYIYKQTSVIGSQAEHTGMRTYYFSADTQEDMNTWLRAMNQATLMQNHSDAMIRSLLTLFISFFFFSQMNTVL